MFANLTSSAIQTVTVASLPAEFTHNDPLANLTVGAPNDPLDCHRHPELKRKLYSALQESDEGELSIAIPLEVALKHSGQSVNPVTGEGALVSSSLGPLVSQGI